MKCINFFCLCLALLIQEGTAWHDYGYNNCYYDSWYESQSCDGHHNIKYYTTNQSSLSYTGNAWGFVDGEARLIPASECDGGCAVNGTCGTTEECNIAIDILYVFVGIFGCVFCTIAICMCRMFCKGAKSASNPNTLVEKNVEENLLQDNVEKENT